MHLSLAPLAARLRRDRSGVSMIEFALTLPVVLTLGCYGIETSNLALTSLQVSQLALNLADNASRVGSMQSDNSTQLREVDINDVLTAARLQGAKLGLTTRGRIIVSSLEESGGKQYIHWQRCLGTQSGADYDSHYGTTPVTAGTQTGSGYAGTVVTGMGKPGAQVTAPTGTGVMFVEVNYLYNPIISSRWLSAGVQQMRYTASFIVRDRRTFDMVYNPAPTAQRYTCDRYTAS
ncbi:pilus assembly protein [Sphingomonas sp. RRHST34]|uniref:Pilus assembly protein n=1 Tax=Sphingomonas citri TaxID=2862499 RepID=A0ABS7BJ17_9SPHN|nr:TadE/TadG family type IV pilus assembly protein [Sphingomonas citri]MBW6529606.1 pilus assembly protein [Sphingomonas citri]